MTAALAPTDIALYLANEGVPIRAIARAIHIPSGDLREQLMDARAAGRLLELPRDDWPPGFPRDQRALQLSRLVMERKGEIALAVGRLFGLTATEATLLLVMLQSSSLEKNRSDMAGNTVDVHVHHIRKRLAAFGIGISTVWGYGYQVSSQDRRKAMGLILEHVASATS